MVTGINSANSGEMQLMMAQFYQKLNAADVDGTKGLSKDELSSIDTSDAGGSAFLKSLTDQFSKLDADSNGQLSSSEIAQAKPSVRPMGPPPGLNLESTDEADVTGSVSSTDTTSAATSTDSDESIKELLQKLMSEIFEKLADGISGEKKSSSDSSDSTTKPVDLASADTDGVTGLSTSELSSIKTSNNAGAKDFINSLINDFKSLDKDGNGQLSQREIDALKSSTTKTETASSKLENSLSNLGSNLGSASSAFMGKLISSYQNGNLSNLASSLSLAV